MSLQMVQKNEMQVDAAIKQGILITAGLTHNTEGWQRVAGMGAIQKESTAGSSGHSTPLS